MLERLVVELDERRACDLDPLRLAGSRTATSRSSACVRPPRIRATVENYLRRGIRGARFRVDKRLDRAAVSRAHDVLYLSDAWTEATWLGAQALKNPLDLWVYQEIMFETRPELVVETGTYRGGSACFLASICDLLGARRGRLDRHRAGARGLPEPSADHLPRRPLLDRPGRRGGRPGARRRESGRS